MKQLLETLAGGNHHEQPMVATITLLKSPTSGRHKIVGAYSWIKHKPLDKL